MFLSPELHAYNAEPNHQSDQQMQRLKHDGYIHSYATLCGAVTIVACLRPLGGVVGKGGEGGYKN